MNVRNSRELWPKRENVSRGSYIKVRCKVRYYSLLISYNLMLRLAMYSEVYCLSRTKPVPQQ